jgi:hypothetical protein
LALSVLVGGAVFASAASSSVTILSTSDVILTNAPAPLIWSSVSDLPTSALFNPDTGVSAEAMMVDTDNGGKIAGVANILKKYYDASGSNVTAVSSWYTTVKGSIKASTMAKPTVQMTLKGEGYLAPGTNTTIIKPGNGTSGFPGKFSLNFNAKDTPAVQVVVTNGAIVETNWTIIGKLTGSITPPTKGAKSEKVDQTASLIVDRIAQDTIAMRIIAYGTKFGAILYGTDATGTATAKNGAYTLNLKPVAGGSSSLQLKGQITAVTQSPFTNITTVTTADIKGKIQGQAVQSTGYKFSGLF